MYMRVSVWNVCVCFYLSVCVCVQSLSMPPDGYDAAQAHGATRPSPPPASAPISPVDVVDGRD